PQSFLEAAQRQLDALKIEGRIGIPANDKGEPKRLTLKINKAEQKKSYTIVGFSVVVKNLTPEAAIKLQAYGLGGKRRMGCGVFSPNLPVVNRRRMRHGEEVVS
ncbi:MAG: type I-MYXAN CRISPR-associated protein Cas6/Cmx6, partial [Cyanobacteria bacterium P01_A01_bin.40]